MRKASLSTALTLVMLPLLLSSTTANAAGFITKNFTCPLQQGTILPAGNRIEITDIIISTSGATDVILKFNPPFQKLVTVWLDANETFVTNFQGQVESAEEQALKVECGGVAQISVTIVGNAGL